jgi:hypothetical protein
MTSTGNTPTSDHERRTLKVADWPEADRLGWEDACRPSCRLKPGGSASHLASVTHDDEKGRNTDLTDHT